MNQRNAKTGEGGNDEYFEYLLSMWRKLNNSEEGENPVSEHRKSKRQTRWDGHFLLLNIFEEREGHADIPLAHQQEDGYNPER